MKRRTFFTWTFLSWVVHLVRPHWVWAGPATSAEAQAQAQTTIDRRLLCAVACVVLPSGLGAAGLDAAVERFTLWVREYKAGAEMSAGYGVTQI